MTITVEQRLDKIEKRLGKLEAEKVDGKALIEAALTPNRTQYLMSNSLATIVQRALVIGSGAVVKFPRGRCTLAAKFYRVASAGEEQEAIASGWSRTPPPPPPSRYPLNMVEIGIGSGPGLGPRGSDYWRVLLHNADEEQRFKQVTESANWVEDAAHELAGRGVFLADLIEEHKARLKSMIDQDLLETVPDNVGHEDSGADPTVAPE